MPRSRGGENVEFEIFNNNNEPQYPQYTLVAMNSDHKIKKDDE